MMEHRRGVRQEPHSSSIPTPRFNQDIATLNPIRRTGGTYSDNGMTGLPEISDLGNASWKMPELPGISKLESQFQD